MTVSTYGVDVSGYQPDGRVPWSDPRVGYGIVKATENVTRSKGLAYHVAAIRKEQGARMAEAGDAVLQLGLYHFFHVESPVAQQLAAFNSAAIDVGYGIGDIIPAVDLEKYSTHAVTPAWREGSEELCAALAQRYGGCMPYINDSVWYAMGKPAWVLNYDLWVPQYNYNGKLPLSECTASPRPGLPRLWQNYVGPMFGAVTGKLQESNSPVGVDQNMLYGEFQLILSLDS